MSKIKKILIASLLTLFLIFIAQKTVNGYLEREINDFVAPFGVEAKITRLNQLTLKSKYFAMPPVICKIKIDNKIIHLIPVNRNLLTNLLPEDIKIPL